MAGTTNPDQQSRSHRSATRTLAGIMVLVVILAAATTLALLLRGEPPAAPGSPGHGSTGEPIGTPTRWTGPQGRTGQFVAKCKHSHSAPDDPIVHHGHPGRSHRHDFYGAEETNADSTAEQLLESPTTCDKPDDLASYWQPTLYDHDRVVEPMELDAYYRAAPGVDPKAVEPFPFGMELIAGDQTTTTATEMNEAAGWTCGSSSRLATEPPECPATAPLHMVLTFPDCWNGTEVRSDDFRSHAAYSHDGECPAGYPVHVPQLTMAIKYPITGAGHELRLASGNVHSAHGDFLNSWNMEGLEREVRQCINRGAVCDLVNNRSEDAPFLAN